MFVDLPPDSPTQAPIVVVADARQIQKPTSAIRTVGVCEPMANLPDDPYFGRAPLDFVAVAVNYLFDYEKLNFSNREAKVAILQSPTHGELTALVKGSAAYKPNLNFYGQDKIVALVELGGYQVKVVYFIKIQPKGSGGVATDNEEVIKQLCGPKGRIWKISVTPTAPYVSNFQGLFNVGV